MLEFSLFMISYMSGFLIVELCVRFLMFKLHDGVLIYDLHVRF